MSNLSSFIINDIYNTTRLCCSNKQPLSPIHQPWVRDKCILSKSVLYTVIPAAGEGFIAIPASVLVQYYFTRRRALAIALSTLGQALSAVVTGPLIRVLINVYAWRGAMLLSAAVSIQGLVCAAAMRPAPIRATSSTSQNSKPNPERNSDSPRTRKLPLAEEPQTGTEKGGTSCCSSPSSSIKRALKSFDLSLWKSANFILLLLSRGLSLSTLWAMHMYAVPRAAFWGIDKLQASMLPFSLGILSICSRFVTGIVTNMDCTNRVIFYSSGQISSGVVAIFSAFLGDQLYILMAAYGLYGLCAGKSDHLLFYPVACPSESA